ncbi:MAG: TonB-dependent receptor [Bdellovibrionales bacterium]|nr:TonB-dependent receptor [Oligoflexia bacterium]
MMQILFAFFLMLGANSFAAESEVTLPRVEFSGSATFETLNNDTYVPSSRTRFSKDRSNTLDDFKWTNPYPAQNYGYPSGASGVNLGGRSVDDTQVTSLGVPLNLPQGGGGDLSFFPSFLWDEVILSPSTSSSGFSPSAASGHLELVPWTRARLVDPRGIKLNSRATLSVDRDLQTYSLASAKEDVAMVAGVLLGRSQGYAGELSYYLLKKPGSHLILHALGTNQKGDSPGSRSYPSPQASKDVWRLIPVIESHQELESGSIIESTLFADFQELSFNDPGPGGSFSNTHTQQYGIENALLSGPYTFALSGRHVRFQSTSFDDVNEWPLYAAATRDFYASDDLSLKVTLNSTYLSKIGLYPGGKVSAKFAADPKTFPFAEISTIAKMPTLTARYYRFGNSYQGNPNLKPEKVHALLFGFQHENARVKSTTTFKAEYRNAIQVSSGTTTLNQGDAYLLSLQKELSFHLLDWITLSSHTLLTGSRLKDSRFSYPDLPFFTEVGGLRFDPSDLWSLETNARYTGPSITSTGAFHEPYTLAAISATYHFDQNIHATLGLDNVFNSNAEAVVDYPLPGRIVYSSIQASF